MGYNPGGKRVDATVLVSAAITEEDFRKAWRTGEFAPAPPNGGGATAAHTQAPAPRPYAPPPMPPR